ncbi:MAG TPA: tetratricopeptide repeat protein [Candidatus Acidoferrales bacterium]|nr:tetratricopeptide repeat protein [Candidatus Acidoferrales bacterium]
MSQHISRKELKKDDFREAFVHGGEAVASHKKLVSQIVIVLLLVAIAVFGWRWYTQWQTGKASIELANAMKTYNAPIRAAGEPADPINPSFFDEKVKYDAAAKQLAVVADHYSRTRPGQEARYFEAICDEQLDRNDRAATELEGISKSSNSDLEPIAKLRLAGVYAKLGKNAQAIQAYQELMAKPTVLVPKPLVMLMFADFYSKTNPAEATKLLNQVKLEFPESPASQEAQKRLEAATETPGHS